MHNYTTLLGLRDLPFLLELVMGDVQEYCMIRAVLLTLVVSGLVRWLLTS